MRAVEISGVWTLEIGEMRQSYGLVQAAIDADREARRTAADRGAAYAHALIEQHGAMFATQLARGASALASIWLYEWKQAGSPDRCAAAVQAGD